MTPPLSVWRNVGLMLIVTIFYFVTYSVSEWSPFHLTSKLYRTHLETWQKTSSNAATAVFLGSSLSGHALGTAAVPIKISCDSSKLPITIHPLFHNGLTPETIEALDIPEMLRQFTPDYLFVEADLLIRKRQFETREKIISDYNIAMIRSYPFALATFSSGFIRQKVVAFHAKKSPTYYTLKPHPVNERLRKMGFFELTDPGLTVLPELVALMKKKGGKVILVKFPVIPVPAYEKLLPEWNRLISDLKDKYGIEYWEAPKTLADNTLYCDGAHMNEKGSQKFTQWFLDKAASYTCSN